MENRTHMRSLHTLLLISGILGRLPLQAQWEQVGLPGSIYGIAVQEGQVFASQYNGGMHVSIDQGATWSGSGTGITNSSSWWIESVDGTLYNGTQFGPTFRSADDGANWVDIGKSGARGFINHDDTLYTCQWYDAAVSWSVDQGTTWHPTATLVSSSPLWPMISHNGYLFVGAQGTGVRRIAHSDDTWSTMNSGLTSLVVYAFASIGDYLLLGGSAGVFRSMDDGQSWQPMGQTPLGQVYALHTVGSLVFVGLDGGGVQFSADSGATWAPINTGLTNMVVARLTNDDNYLYAGTLGGGVHRLLLNDITTGLEEAPGVTTVSVFPVPANDRVQVDWPGHRTVGYVLHDMTGSTVQRGTVDAGGIAVDALAPGLYLLQLQAADGAVRTTRVVRE